MRWLQSRGLPHRAEAIPATFALSVANEIPKDIVRFYGARRVEQFLAELMDAARERAPRVPGYLYELPINRIASVRRAPIFCASTCTWSDRLS